MANALDASLTTVGKPVEGGCVFVDFTPGTYPTDAKTAMSTLTNYESVGEIDENGYTEGRSISSTNLKGWHNTVLRTAITEDTKTYKLALVEVSRATAAKLRYGKDAVEVDGDGNVIHISDATYTGEPVSLVIDELESDGYLRRTVIKNAVITSFDDVSHTQGSLVSYGLTFTVNETSDGTKAIDVYRAKPASE